MPWFVRSERAGGDYAPDEIATFLADLAVRGLLAKRPSNGAERSVNTSVVIVPHGTDLTATRSR